MASLRLSSVNYTFAFRLQFSGMVGCSYILFKDEKGNVSMGFMYIP